MKPGTSNHIDLQPHNSSTILVWNPTKTLRPSHPTQLTLPRGPTTFHPTTAQKMGCAAHLPYDPTTATGNFRPVPIDCSSCFVHAPACALPTSSPYSIFVTKARKSTPLDIIFEHLIGKHDMATVYMSPDPYFEAFEEVIDLRKFNLSKHCTSSPCLAHSNDCLTLGGIAPSTPGASISCWWSRPNGIWLIKVSTTLPSSLLKMHRMCLLKP
jgi:hypothetical protein